MVDVGPPAVRSRLLCGTRQRAKRYDGRVETDGAAVAVSSRWSVHYREVRAVVEDLATLDD